MLNVVISLPGERLDQILLLKKRNSMKRYRLSIPNP